MKITYVSIFTILLVLLSGIPLIISPGAINYASARYANTQTQANANGCNTGTNCAINSPQTQGDGSASSPTNLQISKSREEPLGAPTTPLEPTASLRFIVEVECPTGVVCPTEQNFRYNVQPDTQLRVSTNPFTFSGSHDIVFTFPAGTPSSLGIGYQIFQTAPPTPPGLTLNTHAFGNRPLPNGCEWISGGGYAAGAGLSPGSNDVVCTVVNTYTRS